MTGVITDIFILLLIPNKFPQSSLFSSQKSPDDKHFTPLHISLNTPFFRSIYF